jgi:hypothetical protein
MCRDPEAVGAAIAARLPVHETVCAGFDRRCACIETCPKQQNRAEVAAADVVIAAHDALFTGFGIETSTIGVILIDESFWQRAGRESRELYVESFALELLGHSLRGRDADDGLADLHDLRQRAVAALGSEGPVARSALLGAGLDEEACRLAVRLEERRLRDPGLVPGLSGQPRKAALDQVRINEGTYRMIEVWRALQDLAAGTREHDGRLHVRSAAAGLHEIVVTGVKAIHPTLRDKPVLHLNATLRPDLTRCVLRDLEVREVEAAAPHATIRLVSGSFGKGQLCVGSRRDTAEAQRRANRLGEVVVYVRWQAVRVAPGRVLVVTYKDVEDVFARIPGVEVGHFNAIAGLDLWRDVRLLIVVGRPLPSDTDLAPLAGAFFRQLPEGRYGQASRGIRMRDGTSRAVRVIEHADETAEILRAAICDDELVQAIGRGRAVNRTSDDPLEVHVLADVALPLVYDRVLDWESVRPRLFQRMLLAGIAVDSPGDAARLHPGLFNSSAAAEKAFQREGFGGQNPITDLYREMSAKSAAYRRPGRGRSWQRAWWIDGDANAARRTLEGALGALGVWHPDP